MHLSEMVAEGQVFMKERKNPRRVKTVCLVRYHESLPPIQRRSISE